MCVHFIAIGGSVMRLLAIAVPKKRYTKLVKERTRKSSMHSANQAAAMRSLSYGDTKLLLVSSANFDGADMLTFAKQVIGSNL